jgi:hypothetical protein
MMGGLLRRVLRFPHQRGKGREVTQEIMATFSAGFARGLRKESRETFEAARQAQPWHQRSFFCEGHAMGRAARSAIGPRRNPDAFYGDDAFLAARFIGYGFWNGVASRYPLPALSLDPSYCPDMRPLLIDGASYGRMLSRRRFDAAELAHFRAMANPADRDAALHGAGRVLWLFYMYNFDALRMQLEQCSALASGLGFAIGFIHARETPEILAILKQLPPAVADGAGVALALHMLHDTESCRAVSAQLNGELQEVVDKARRDAGGYWGLRLTRSS